MNDKNERKHCLLFVNSFLKMGLNCDYENYVNYVKGRCS